MNANLWDKFGICVAADVASGAGSVDYDLAVIQADAEYLVNVCGIKYVRISTGAYYYTTLVPAWIDRFHAIAQIYLDLGAHVQFVISGSYNPSTQNWYEGYADYVALQAAWAESVGVERLQLENELELTSGSITDINVRDYVLTLPAIARAAGYTGELTYSLAGGAYAWTTKGDYNDLGIDTYTQYGNVVTQVNDFIDQFGIENVYVSEWGAYQNLNTTDPEVQSREMMRILNYLKSKFDVPCYMFAWKWIRNGVYDEFSAKTKVDGNFRRFWYDVTGQRSPIVKYSRDFVHISRPQIDTFDINKLGGKALWLKADAGVYSDAGITPASNGDAVYQWSDQSGMGNHATQSVAYKRPDYFTNIKNGLPSVFFNSDEYNIMQCANPSNFNIEWPTIFVVTQWSSGSKLFGKGDGALWPAATSRKLQFGALNSANAVFWSGSDTTWVSAAAVMSDWNIFLLQGERSNFVNLNVNGVNKITTVNNLNFKDFNSVPFKIGAGFTDGSEPATFSLLELIIFNRILPQYQCRQVLDYLSTKWDIAISN